MTVYKDKIEINIDTDNELAKREIIYVLEKYTYSIDFSSLIDVCIKYNLAFGFYDKNVCIADDWCLVF